MRRKLPELALVVPCYNEEEALPSTHRRLSKVLDEMKVEGLVAPSSHILFVDDGSSDGTWSLVERAVSDGNTRGLKLSRNFGHQSAMLAGLFSAKSDCVVTIDADLQDDVLAIKIMVEKYLSGTEIVYGVRESRDNDTFFKRATANYFYKLMRQFGAETVDNHADFRLMSRRAIEALQQFEESNLFVRGIVPLLGYKADVVRYRRAPRTAGVSKYPLRKMLSLAVAGITSLSVAPLRMITALGILISALSFAFGVWALFVALRNPSAVPGWASIVVSLYFLGGLQLLSLGVIGEYMAKAYIETKRRPRYQIELSI